MFVGERVLTRKGAVQDVTNWQRRFQVEMAEIASSLSHAGPRSIKLLDKIGRETRTSDNTAISWSLTEELYQTPKDMATLTMFVTHFNELPGHDVHERRGAACRHAERQYRRRCCRGGVGVDECSKKIPVVSIAGYQHGSTSRGRTACGPERYPHRRHRQQGQSHRGWCEQWLLTRTLIRLSGDTG